LGMRETTKGTRYTKGEEILGAKNAAR